MATDVIRRNNVRVFGGGTQGYAQDVLDVIHSLDLHDVIFVGHSVSSMVGVLATNREPGRIAELVLIGPSPRYINDSPYVGGFERGDIDGLFEMMDKNFIGWANFLAPAIVKNPDRPELGEELTRSFCSTRCGRREAPAYGGRPWSPLTSCSIRRPADSYRSPTMAPWHTSTSRCASAWDTRAPIL